jgi:hypothetical protein
MHSGLRKAAPDLECTGKQQPLPVEVVAGVRLPVLLPRRRAFRSLHSGSKPTSKYLQFLDRIAPTALQACQLGSTPALHLCRSFRSAPSFVFPAAASRPRRPGEDQPTVNKSPRVAMGGAPAEQRSTIPGFSPRTHENRITDGLVLDICGVGDRRTAARPIKMLKPGAQGRVPLK